MSADFPDEFAHSKDTKELRGANMYAKANSSCIIMEMIEIATNKTFAENYAQKHNTDAKFGWYRYDTRFAIPVYNDAAELVRYNVFKARSYFIPFNLFPHEVHLQKQGFQFAIYPKNLTFYKNSFYCLQSKQYKI